VTSSGGRPTQAAPSTPALPTRRRRAAIVSVLAALALAGTVVGVRRMRSVRGGAPDRPVFAIGRIASYRVDSAGAALAAPVADLLATNLARVPGVRVVSTARLHELLGSSGDSSPGAFAGAARRAGATELVDGTLYVRPGGRLRLDLRRTDLSSGDLRTTHTAEGSDVFALVDSGTARLVAALGAAAPAGSVADVTTRSVVAYRLYTEGQARQAALDPGSAARLFAAAVAEDSTFAMAVYGLAQNVGDVRESIRLYDRALQLSANATDRERLMIRAGWAFKMSSPSLSAVAETLAVRYPDEVEGPLYRGIALFAAQEYAASVPYLERVVAMDSAAVDVRRGGGRRPRCATCDALQSLVGVYSSLDSLDAAERTARRWVRLQPTVAAGWFTLAGVLDARERPAEALAALRQASAADPAIAGVATEALATHYIRVGDYDAAARLLLARRESAAPDDAAEASWYLAIGRRQEGKLREALAEAERARAGYRARAPVGAAPATALLQAQILTEMGRWREGAALFDSVGRWELPGAGRSALSRNRAWTLTHAATALAGGGDTARLPAIADSVEREGAASFLGRDHRLHHHVRGLLLAARGRDAEAAAELRAAMGTLTLGYTRTNLELGRVLLRSGRAAEAASVLAPALRAGIEGSGLYASRTELHETLARAWDAAGRRDSAAAHWAVVARDWASGDPPFAARAKAAAARLGH
jgi:tetratricopeptide (TPR) repeat protein